MCVFGVEVHEHDGVRVRREAGLVEAEQRAPWCRLRQIQPSSAVSWARVFLSTRLLALSTARSNFWYPGQARTVTTTPAMTSSAKTVDRDVPPAEAAPAAGTGAGPLPAFFVPALLRLRRGPYVW